jgi:hypothetical protein
MPIDKIMDGIESKGLYDIVFDIVNPLGKHADLTDHDISETVKVLKKKREEGWVFLQYFGSELQRRLSIHPHRKFTMPRKLSSMREYWEIIQQRLPLTAEELKAIKEDSSCTDDPRRTLCDLFGKPGMPDQKRYHLRQAAGMIFDGLLQTGVLRKSYAHSADASLVIESERVKSLYRTFDKVCTRSAEIMVARRSGGHTDGHTASVHDAKRCDALGIKLILGDRGFVEPIMDSVVTMVPQIAAAHPSYSIKIEDHYKKSDKNDHSIHIDVSFPDKRYFDTEIILTSKLDFWIDEFCSQDSHMRYMFKGAKGMDLAQFNDRYHVSLNNRQFKQVQKDYNDLRRTLVTRANGFLDRASKSALELGEDTRHYVRVH